MSVDDLRELYQEVILDHNKNPRNYGELILSILRTAITLFAEIALRFVETR